jgi:hypothetical protein
MGFFSQIYQKAKNSISNVINEIKNRGTAFFTGSNYIGPFNRLDEEYLRTHPPKDAADATALTHDKDYARIASDRDSSRISREQANRMIRESDDRFLNGMNQNFHTNPWGATLGHMGIAFKKMLEDKYGLDRNLFVNQ